MWCSVAAVSSGSREITLVTFSFSGSHIKETSEINFNAFHVTQNMWIFHVITPKVTEFSLFFFSLNICILNSLVQAGCVPLLSSHTWSGWCWSTHLPGWPLISCTFPRVRASHNLKPSPAESSRLSGVARRCPWPVVIPPALQSLRLKSDSVLFLVSYFHILTWIFSNLLTFFSLLSAFSVSFLF